MTPDEQFKFVSKYGYNLIEWETSGEKEYFFLNKNIEQEFEKLKQDFSGLNDKLREVVGKSNYDKVRGIGW